jgi:hypothetical protein
VALFLAGNAWLAVALLVFPAGGAATAARPPAHWDIPLRMLVATLLVLGLTAAAPSVGAGLAGIFSSYPVFASTLAVFAHRQLGGGGAVNVLRGLLFGLFGYTGFFLALGLLVEPAGPTAAFIAAIAVNLCVQIATLWVVRRRLARSDHGGCESER